VYVDGELAEVSTHPEQRALWLLLNRSRAHRIELLAVSADDADALWRPHPELLRGWSPGFVTQAGARVLRDEALPVDARLRVHVDGAIEAEEPLWPADAHRAGFGALFGQGAFGFDDATAPGLGSPTSALGVGPLGIDSTSWQWRRDDLAAGAHLLELTAVDARGAAVASPLALPEAHIDALAAPPGELRIDPDFTLRWSD
jgi:hypothetical protein